MSSEGHSEVSFKIIIIFISPRGGEIHWAGEAVGLALASSRLPKPWKDLGK